ncbi:MAG: hypothetical protein EON52_02495 [Actinomycetales bacterium]|nr:MAG: hypothetical protein EON52_02495 [Actinomycetales bacterium]
MTSSPCSEWEDGIGVEMGTWFVVDTDDLGEVVRKIGRAWKAEGWEVDPEVNGYPTPHVLFDTGPRNIKRAIGTATTLHRDLEQGREHNVVEIHVISTCIDPPDDGLPVDWPFGPA